MNLRFFVVLGLIAAAIFFGVTRWALVPDSGETEFQHARDAMKTVNSWKFAEIADPNSPFSQEGTWEVNCATGWHGVFHVPSYRQDSANATVEMSHLGGNTFQRTAGSAWETADTYAAPQFDPSASCAGLAQGQTAFPFPAFGNLTESSFFTNNGTKKVNGVKCREWRVQTVKMMRKEEQTICLGVSNHLPYEIAGSPGRPHLVFSDYNKTTAIEGPK